MTSAFTRALAERNPTLADPRARRWLFVPYDQLSAAIGPLSREPAVSLGIVLVETPAKARRRPYHKQKLALILANLRQFALEQAERGVAVRHYVDARGYAPALEAAVAELGPLRTMEPAERELRAELAPLVARGALEVLPHEGWLTRPEQFRAAHPKGPPWRMDRFYRQVRRDSGVLMDDAGKPLGGRFSLDGDNREPWPGEPEAPTPPRFAHRGATGAVTREVGELVAREFADHPGELDLSSLPATARQAQALWRWAKRACMHDFGRFQDAMSSASASLFHTRISALLHLHRLLPRTVVDDALALELPLASQEGFVRQVLGWREFVRHVHRETDGFRQLPPGFEQPREAANFFGSRQPLPPAYWGQASGLRCLDEVVTQVWREGYGHHITRLMVLANLATLLGVDPHALNHWFWVAYVDAFDWVVEPNVLGMGSFAVGELMTTKPYLCGANYIAKMGDFCRDCAFDPKRSCPITSAYWAFLDREGERLAGNRRLAMPLRSVAKRSAARREHDRAVLEWMQSTLAAGEPLDPAQRPRGGG